MVFSKPIHTSNYIILLIASLFFAGMVLFLDLVPGNPEVSLTAAIALYMAILWVTEAIPIPITSLLPIILFPALGILDGKAISNAYINYVIFLFIGGFFMALAMEKWDLHQRIALKILSWLGGSPLKILMGFMLASAFLSMWMSNTATAMMMLPIVFSVTSALEELHGAESIGKFSIGILLGVAYACSIGGIATLVGTPPNLSFVRITEIMYPNSPEIAFGEWLIFALPLSGGMFFIILFILYFFFPIGKGLSIQNTEFFKEKYQALGPATKAQKRLFLLFLLLVFLWVFRKSLTIGSLEIPGWSILMPEPGFINDGTVAIFVAFLLFITPASTAKTKEGLLSMDMISKLPWGIVLLFGGGFALARGFVDSGLSVYLGQQLVAAKELGNMGLLFSVTTFMTFLTEFTSNTATTEMMLPIVSGLAGQIQIHPLYLMIPVTLAASMAFMFPVATPPNAVIFGSGKIHIWDMVKAGFLINILGIVMLVVVFSTWGTLVFDIDPDMIPDWAETPEVEP
jgi:sodium-dependent dicarboxylate transporter 2/3/5